MKNKTLKSLIVGGLVCVVACGALAGCKKPKTLDPEIIEIGGGEVDWGDKKPVDPVSGKYFVKSQKTDYVIVTPKKDEDDKILQTAVEEFSTFFNEATSVLPAHYTDDETLPADAKYFSLGNTKYAEAKLTDTPALTTGAYRMKTADDNLYIVGGDSHGVLYGVYDLLDYMFDFEFYKKDVYTLNKNVETLNFFEVDEVKTPDIAYAPGYSSISKYNTQQDSLRYRMRRHTEITVLDGKDGDGFHNSFVVLPPDTWSGIHPEWYAGGRQLCYTAGDRDSQSYREFIQAIVNHFVPKLLAEPEKTYVMLTEQDDDGWCKCPGCTSVINKYGAKSTTALLACHDVYEAIKNDPRMEGDPRDVHVVPFLYREIEDVPVKKEGDKYVLSDPSLDLTGVTPMWANIRLRQHAYAYTHPVNKTALDMLDRLNAAFDDFWIWDYGVDFKDYFAPFNVFNNLSEDFKLLKNYNVSLYLYQLDHTAHNATAFGALKTYLISELIYDADQDVEKLTDNFFEAVYGEAAAPMRKIYDDYRLLAAYNDEDHGEVKAWDQSIYSQTMLKAEYYPKGVLVDWLDRIDECYKAIEPLKKSNPAQYDLYYNNILAESIFVRYIYAYIYLGDENAENILFKTQIYYDVQALNFAAVSEEGTIWALAAALKIGAYL